ncbi:uncharacterized protein LOC120894023 [Anopheles arabiensis]|uniref:uncharacterized protein LOC120894023 n=1 Tax=Anopheles arabiensis TaxID=7173 RepID=UPI001AAD2ECF|nr:uncharacterized protein LOC120894023 [Anopheles arabiensis]
MRKIDNFTEHYKKMMDFDEGLTSKNPQYMILCERLETCNLIQCDFRCLQQHHFKRNDMEEVCLGYFSFLEHSTRASNWNRSFPLRPNVFDRFFDSLREQCLFIARCPTPQHPRVYGCSVQRITGCSDIYRQLC